MKKVTKRASAVLIVALLVMLGVGIYMVRLVAHGGEWASFFSASGVADTDDPSVTPPTLTDRDGLVLLQGGPEGYEYSESALVRSSCLHVLGDLAGNIGTGALSMFQAELANYSFVSGITQGGATVALSIDADLNAAAYEALAGRKGAVMVYNYQTGEILCMVSSPSYDPLTGFDESDPAYEGAYINRCISASMVPGSIFKIVTLAAALENIDDLWQRSFYCAGSVSIGGVTINCSGVHGSQSIDQAFANSCNCAFAEISAELGGDLLTKYAEKYGLTEEHELHGISVKAGSVESAGYDSANAAWQGIGQYKDLVCPYSMLRLVGAIANNGQVAEPTLLAGDAGSISRLMKTDTAVQLASMLNYNAVYRYNSDSAFPGLDISAKTGTAEVGDGSSHAWITGFVSNPGHPYAFVVLVENAGVGLQNAGSVANAVLQKAVFG